MRGGNSAEAKNPRVPHPDPSSASLRQDDSNASVVLPSMSSRSEAKAPRAPIRLANPSHEPYNAVMGDQDKGYKLLFSNKEMVRDLIAGFVDPEIAVELELDPDSMVREHSDFIREQRRKEGKHMLLSVVEERAIEKGKKRGIELGEKRTKRESALRMLHAGLSIDDISKFSGLSEDEVRKLAEETRN